MKHVAREPKVLTLSLYRNGTMNVEMGNWRPVNMHILADPDARAFTEAIRQLTLRLMKSSRGIEIPV